MNSHQQVISMRDEPSPDEQTALLPGCRRRGLSWIKRSSNLKSQPITLLPSVLLGIAIWFGITPTDELTPTAVHLLAVFTSCIFALITTSVDISLLVLTGLTFLSITQSFQCSDRTTGQSVECRLCGEENPLSGELYECKGSKEAFAQSLQGFSSPVVWLIFSAFHLGKAVEVTGLGRRLSLLMISVFGSNTLGLAYAIVFSEILLAPFVPSNTARGGGIVMPVVSSIASTLGSTPTRNSKVGGYLMLVGAQSNLLSASMYLTGMAANPIVLAKANHLFPELHFSFLTWFSGSVVPSLFCAVCLPWILAWACGLWHDNNSETKTEPNDHIIKHAQDELHGMGSMSLREWQLCLVLLTCLCLWVTSGYTSLDATLVALLGLVALLHMGTITWKDMSANTSAWDTFFWLGGFVTIAQQLSDAGASAFVGHRISAAITHSGLPAVPCLAVAYFLTTFMFSSLSAHIVAFVATFLEAGHVLGANPMVLTGFLAYFGALAGCMTNFSTGTAAMYFAPGYVKRSTWFIIGFELAAFYILVYFTLGMGWWKVLGWH